MSAESTTVEPSDQMGKFTFDGAEGIAFWVNDGDPELEHNSRVMFDDLPTMVAFLRHNLPGLFPEADSAAARTVEILNFLTNELPGGMMQETTPHTLAVWIDAEMAKRHPEELPK
ncbi:MAG: hypothetical protein K0S37_777 [Microbacterium sp.]|jgi:hypothetical protein|nr:hypothetical protein [Microbacterium sp.]